MPEGPGRTCNLSNSVAASRLITLIVNNPLSTDEVILDMPAELIAADRPSTVLFGDAGTATNWLLILSVSPTVNTGLAFNEVMTPYNLD